MLHAYVLHGFPAARSAAELGLTRALEAVHADDDACTRMRWVRVLAEAAAVSDDERLGQVVLQSVPSVIAAIESHIQDVYEPGEGLVNASCREELDCADALMAAFEMSGRIQYAMLAEELLQHVRRHWWNEIDGRFDADLATNAVALHDLVHVLMVQRDSGYLARVTPMPDLHYAPDARRLSVAVGAGSGRVPEAAAEIGMALAEWFALEPDLQ
jgi:uncharacterized protein YyaL (SSP411 family)